MKTATKTPATFPFILTFGGRRYYETTKRGVRVCNGLRAAEYADNDDSRVWLDADGNVYLD